MNATLKNLCSAHWQDILLAIILGLWLGVYSFHQAQRIPPVVYEGTFNDIWFESDSPRIYKNMTNRESDYSRGKVHPLFALTAFPSVYVTKKILHGDVSTAVRMVTSSVACGWIMAMFILLRLIGCRRLDAFLLSLLGGVSAAAMFFLTLPETYPFGSLSLLYAFILAAVSQTRSLSLWQYVAVNIATVGMTTTNWMAGLLTTVINHDLRRIITIVVLSMVIVLGGWGMQKVLFPTSGNFLNIAKESAFILRPEAGGPAHAVRSMFFHTLVMPEITTATDPQAPGWIGMITQPSAAGSATVWGAVAVILWIVLLSAGFWKLVLLKTNFKFRFVLGFTLLGQFFLHLVYGFETFLYSLHFIALLIPLAALTCTTKFRPAALTLLVLLLTCVYVNNSVQFTKAVQFVEHHYPSMNLNSP